MSIKSCYESMENPPVKKYQELQNFKAARKSVIHDYSENIKLPFQVYRIIQLLSSNPPYTAVTKVSIHQTKTKIPQI